MKVSSVAHKLAILAITACLSMGQLHAASAPNVPQRGSDTPPASPTDNRADLIALIATLAGRYDVQIVVSPDLVVAAGVTAPHSDVSLSDALNTITKQIDNAVWRRVYTKQDARLASPEKLAASVRALDHLPQRRLVVENAATQRAILFLPHNSTADMKTQAPALDSKSVVLFYDATLPADGKTRAERLADLHQQQMELLKHLPAGRIPNPMLRGMQFLQNLDPTAAASFLSKAGQAGMKLWESTSPDVRDEMMQRFMDVTKWSMATSQNPVTDDGASPDGQALRNYNNELRLVMNALAKHHKIRVLIDPSILVTAPPQRPGGSMTVDQAMDAVTRSLPGITWRRVYSEPSTIPSMATGDIVAMIRTLENVGQNDIAMANPLTQYTTHLQTNLELSSAFLRERMVALQFSSRPIYVIYAIHEEDGSPIDRRLSDLQRQQFKLLVSMDSAQMTQMMAQEIEQYSGLGADAQSSMMQSPVMAIMMATWFPRKAKEDRAP